MNTESFESSLDIIFYLNKCFVKPSIGVQSKDLIKDFNFLN